jgi:peptidoglycan/LPS O-acetylase OafA/YrhL
MQARNVVRADFRTDINGLRAWAVVAVILYHFGVPGFSGGFVGVDVFFVISGFLMTGICVKGLERGTFSLMGFYLARAKRIIPALVVLCGALLALGWFVLLTPDYLRLGTHTVYSLSFLSNVEFWKEAGYFDIGSHEKWLLHTWSLSVEWQFYMLLPIALWATWAVKAGRTAQALVVGLSFAASFCAAVMVTRSDPSGAFFLLHTRAWEMLGGGLVFLFAQSGTLPPGLRGWLEKTGLLFIVAAVVLFDKASAWPSWRAMLPVAGAMMVVAASGSSPLTANRAAQWLGDRSYSLYLWHWPVCVALFYIEANMLPLAVAGGLAVTLLLGHLSYHLVEKQAKIVLGPVRWRAASAIALAMVAVALPGIAIWKKRGVPGRFSPAVEMAAAEANNFNPRRPVCHMTKGVTSPSCMYGGTQRKVILAGDSHADAIVTSLANADPGGNAGVVQWSYSGCPFLPGMKSTPDYLASVRKDYRCAEFNDWVAAEIERAPASIALVIAGRYSGAAKGANEMGNPEDVPEVYFSTIYPVATPAYLQEFGANVVRAACRAARQRPVYLMRPLPEMGVDVPKTMSRRISFGQDGEVSIALEDYLRRNAWIIAAQDEARATCGVKILDPLPYLCHDGRCYGTRAGRALYFDDDHLSEYGNKLLVPMFAEVYKAH